MDRVIGAGPITGERALEYSFSGPNLRAAGVDYDVRVMNPYCSYQDFDFDIPVGKDGDTYDRFVVRQEEIRQSVKIIRQALEKCHPVIFMPMSLNSICRPKKRCIAAWNR